MPRCSAYPKRRVGQSVKGVVRTSIQGRDRSASDELMDWCENAGATTKCPRSVLVRAQLRRPDTGQRLKQEMVEKYSTADQP